MNQEFLNELKASGYVHTPLPLHFERSFEATLEDKEILKRRVLWHDGEESAFTYTGPGEMFLAEGKAHDGKNAIALEAPLRSNSFDGPTAMHQNFGIAKIHLPIDREDWSEYNRFSFYITPDYQGGENLTFIAGLVNDGEVKIPDIYFREGYHVINVVNHTANHIIWEFQDLPRDCITEVVFYIFLSGNNGLTDKNVLYYIDDIALEYVEQPDHAKGWIAPYDLISYPTSGYMPWGKKTAIATMADAGEFNLVSAADNSVVYSGKVEKVTNRFGDFGVIDFSDINTEGEYYIQVGDYKTDIFPISKSVVEEATWKVINFLFCERCGYPVPGIHEGCHRDLIGEHNGKKIAMYGGWHDAGDVSQGILQTGEIAMALFEAAYKADRNSQLYLRLLEEAEWGLDILVRSRFGDGYRLDGEGSGRYTDGIIGTFDDLKVNVNNLPLNNFISAAIEAYAGIVLKERYEGRGLKLISIAKEDFGFAMEEYEKSGSDLERTSGHSRTTSEPLFCALASEAASRIYEATGEEYYAKKAEEFVDTMLKYQETGDAGIPITGFFYRDIEHKYPQHFNHQSREQGFMRALVLLCNTQKDNPKLPVWENAMKLYAQYLKDLMKYAAPYGMIPSGVYSMDEATNKELFEIMQTWTKFEDEKDNLVEQIQNGAKIGDKHYVRVFPVWFSFRGNAAVHCASGKAATMLGEYFNDEELMQIGLEQLYWMAGKNPFLQSLIYGEGRRYCQQYALSTGEMTGEVPVGMESYGNEDIPYWPQGNNCTYKEVWTSPAGRWLWVAADLLG